MLNDEIRENALFKELVPIAKGLDMAVVDVVKTIHGDEVHVSVTINKNDGETGIDDCEIFHRAVLPRLELMFGRDVLSMEVSTPGLQRAFRDVYEFSVFTGRQIRLYSTLDDSWLVGKIDVVDSNSVILRDCTVENGNVAHSEYKVDFANIQKAKLDCFFTSKNNIGNRKDKDENRENDNV